MLFLAAHLIAFFASASILPEGPAKTYFVPATLVDVLVMCAVVSAVERQTNKHRSRL
jgi:hypothetical protein